VFGMHYRIYCKFYVFKRFLGIDLKRLILLVFLFVRNIELVRQSVYPVTVLYVGLNDVTKSMVTTRSPFCGYNLA